MAKWIYPNVKLDELRNDKDLAVLSDVALQVLVNRGFTDASSIKQFLYSGMSNMHDPRKLKDAEKATDIIMDAISNGEPIVVYGDYDCDGVCSVTVMTDLLRKAGGKVQYFTNNRFKHGYSVSPSGVDDLLALYPDTKLIVTVDNGIMAHEGVAHAKSKGIRVIVTDHHEQGETLPNADAIVNPKRKDCDYPFAGLCGAGVAFKLMLLLYWKMDKPLETVYDTLDIVALATVGDIVPLVDENRILVKEGLKRIENQDRLVFKVFQEVTGAKVVNAHYTLAFQYVPMINAIGRIDGDPRQAIDMFFESDESLVKDTIKYLKEVNDDRKQMTEEQCQEAEEIIEAKGLKHVIVVYKEDFHEGIVGLIAGRIKEKYNRPVFILTKNGDQIKGSGRGIDGFHLKEALDELAKQSLIVGGGGHAKACGLTLTEDMLEGFEKVVNEMAEKCLTEDDFQKIYHVDYVLKPGDVTLHVIEDLKELEPFGEAFSKPTLVVDGFQVDRTFNMGTEKQHLKLMNNNLSMIAWSGTELYSELGQPKRVKAIGYPEINIWNNKVSVQFIVDNDNLQPA